MRLIPKLLLVFLLLSAGCNTASPDPGQEAVLVRKPWVFGHGGVDSKPVTTGMSWLAPSTQVWYVVVQPQQFQEHFDDLFSRDGTPLDFDASMRVQVTDSVKLVQHYGTWEIQGKGPAWYVNNLKEPFRTAVRQSVRNHGMNELVISSTAVDAVDSEVHKALEQVLKESKLPIALIDLTVGRANPPDAIKTQRAETAAQEQRANTERQRKLAEDQRREAEISKASADKAYLEGMRLSPEQFVQLEYFKTLDRVCKDGKCTIMLGGSAMPTLPVR